MFYLFVFFYLCVCVFFSVFRIDSTRHCVMIVPVPIVYATVDAYVDTHDDHGNDYWPSHHRRRHRRIIGFGSGEPEFLERP